MVDGLDDKIKSLSYDVVRLQKLVKSLKNEVEGLSVTLCKHMDVSGYCPHTGV